MTVRELLNMEHSGSMFKVVAFGIGCCRDDAPCLLEAGREIVSREYGDCKLYSFAPAGKRTIKLIVYIV